MAPTNSKRPVQLRSSSRDLGPECGEDSKDNSVQKLCRTSPLLGRQAGQKTDKGVGRVSA